jgi:AraC family transcriptional regulator
VSAESLYVPGTAGERFGVVLGTRRAGDFVLRESRYGGDLALPRHHHHESYFVFVVDGAVRERGARGAAAFGASSVHFHPAGDAHEARMAPGGLTCLSIVPPLRVAGRLVSLGTGALAGPRLAALARRCGVEFARTDAASDLALEALAFELVAGALRAPGTRGPARPPRWFARVQERLHAAPADPFALADLAALAGVHPVSVVRAFRRQTGLTPGAYLRRLRLEQAAHALAAGVDPIAQIALDAGFSSQAHFTRAFTAHFGRPPGAYRRERRPAR